MMLFFQEISVGLKKHLRFIHFVTDIIFGIYIFPIETPSQKRPLRLGSLFTYELGKITVLSGICYRNQNFLQPWYKNLKKYQKRTTILLTSFTPEKILENHDIKKRGT